MHWEYLSYCLGCNEIRFNATMTDWRARAWKTSVHADRLPVTRNSTGTTSLPSSENPQVSEVVYWDLFFLQLPFYATRQWPDSIRSLRRRIVNSLSKGITPTQTGRKFTVRRIPNREKRPMAHRLSAGTDLIVSVRIIGEPAPDTPVWRPG